jgi:uncharacterized membrane protein YcjF (UPF0283 family)
MDESTSNPNPTAKQLATEQPASVSAQQTTEQSPTALGQELAVEHRQAYGTAKTENLRDSGTWRYLLPGFVVLCCAAVLAIPVVILALLFHNAPSFVWVWIVMLIIEVGIAVLIIRGLVRIFMTQAGNY